MSRKYIVVSRKTEVSGQKTQKVVRQRTKYERHEEKKSSKELFKEQIANRQESIGPKGAKSKGANSRSKWLKAEQTVS